MAIANTPTGTLTRKHHCQEMLSDNQPPSVGPTTGATTTATPNSAKAWPRFAGGNESARIDWATGTMPPPPTPRRMRNNNNAFRFGGLPQNNGLKVDSPKEIRKKGVRADPFGRILEGGRMNA